MTASALSSSPARPPRVRLVVRNPAPDEIDVPVDWSSWYLTDEEDMGQSIEQEKSISVFKSSLEQLATERSWAAVHLGADTFFAWMQEEPLVRVSPDVYLLDDPPPAPMPKSIQTWRPGHRPPRFALEIVSDDWKKDYDINPDKYAMLGTRELVIFDPDAAAAPDRYGHRSPLQVYRHQPDGSYVRVYVGSGPVVSTELETTLVLVHDGPVARLRLAHDREGHLLVPTAKERGDLAEAARQQAEAARQQAEAARQQAEAARQRAEAARQQAEDAQAKERIAREAAERELAELREVLRGKDR